MIATAIGKQGVQVVDAREVFSWVKVVGESLGKADAVSGKHIYPAIEDHVRRYCTTNHAVGQIFHFVVKLRRPLITKRLGVEKAVQLLVI